MLPAWSEGFTLFCFFIICTLKYSGYLHFSVFCNYHNLHRFVQCRANVCYKISLYNSQNAKGVADEFLRVKPLYYLKKIDFLLTRKRTWNEKYDKYCCSIWVGQLSLYSDWLRAGRSGNESRWGQDFPSVQTGPGVHPPTCTMGTEYFSGADFGRGLLLTTHSVTLKLWHYCFSTICKLINYRILSLNVKEWKYKCNPSQYFVVKFYYFKK